MLWFLHPMHWSALIQERLCNMFIVLHHLLQLKTQTFYYSVNEMALIPYYSTKFLIQFWYINYFVFSFLSLTLYYSFADYSNIPWIFFFLLSSLEVWRTNVFTYTKDSSLSIQIIYIYLSLDFHKQNKLLVSKTKDRYGNKYSKQLNIAGRKCSSKIHC